MQEAYGQMYMNFQQQGDNPTLVTSSTVPPAHLNPQLVTNMADSTSFWISSLNAREGMPPQSVHFALDSLRDTSVPEPEVTGLLAAGAGMLLLSRGLRRWTRRRTS